MDVRRHVIVKEYGNGGDPVTFIILSAGLEISRRRMMGHARDELEGAGRDTFLHDLSFCQACIVSAKGTGRSWME